MDELAFFRQHSTVTDPGARRPLFARLTDIEAMTGAIDGVMVHRDETVWRFGFTLPPQRREDAQTRFVGAMLAQLGNLDERAPTERFAGTCRDFTVLLCAMLRESGVPARARAAFANYFTEGFFDDHWVVELWDGRAWRLVDAQVASAPKGTYRNDSDPLDVPRDAFVAAGPAWIDCRAGRRDPGVFGVHAAGLSGMWEIQGNVVRDLASLNRVETLPWDSWGLIPVHYDALEPSDRELLDRLAEVGAAGGPAERAAPAYALDPRVPAPPSMAG